MANRCHRMDEEHPGTGKAHDLTDTLPHLWLVTVHLTVGAEGLRLHERAFIAAHSGIRFQFGTFRAELCFSQPGCFSYGFMLFLAVQENHVGNYLLFPLPLILYLFVVICFVCFTQCYLLSISFLCFSSLFLSLYFTSPFCFISLFCFFYRYRFLFSSLTWASSAPVKHFFSSCVRFPQNRSGLRYA